VCSTPIRRRSRELIRTVIIIIVLLAFVRLTGQWTNPLQLSGKTWLFLVLPDARTGASWICYFRALQLGDASQGTSSRIAIAARRVLFWTLAGHERAHNPLGFAINRESGQNKIRAD
jgi:uncharacterized membrane protein